MCVFMEILDEIFNPKMFLGTFPDQGSTAQVTRYIFDLKKIRITKYIF